MRDYFGRTNEGLFICKACGKTQRSYSNMRHHVESKHYSPGYTCQTCRKTFQVNQVCNKHQKICVLWVPRINHKFEQFLLDKIAIELSYINSNTVEEDVCKFLIVWSYVICKSGGIIKNGKMVFLLK